MRWTERHGGAKHDVPSLASFLLNVVCVIVPAHLFGWMLVAGTRSTLPSFMSLKNANAFMPRSEQNQCRQSKKAEEPGHIG
jgi:hypothetical protein